MLPMDASVSSGFKKVLEQMAYDTVTQVVKSDTLILSLGERMFSKNGENVRQWSDIRNKMMELARLLLHLFTLFLHLFSGKSRRHWSTMERKLIEHYFKGSLMEMKTPGKEECQRFLKEHQTLRDNGRDWKAVKYFVHNKITAIKRKLNQQY